MALIDNAWTASALLAVCLTVVSSTAHAIETVNIECNDSNGWRSDSAYGEHNGKLVSVFSPSELSSNQTASNFYGVVTDCQNLRSLLIDVTGDDNMQARMDFAFYGETLAKKAQSQSLEQLEVEFIQAGLRTEIGPSDTAACICQSEGNQ